jgi:hypothetical protein
VNIYLRIEDFLVVLVDFQWNCGPAADKVTATLTDRAEHTHTHSSLLTVASDAKAKASKRPTEKILRVKTLLQYYPEGAFCTHLSAQESHRKRAVILKKH